MEARRTLRAAWQTWRNGSSERLSATCTHAARECSTSSEASRDASGYRGSSCNSSRLGAEPGAGPGAESFAAPGAESSAIAAPLEEIGLAWHWSPATRAKLAEALQSHEALESAEAVLLATELEELALEERSLADGWTDGRAELEEGSACQEPRDWMPALRAWETLATVDPAAALAAIAAMPEEDAMALHAALGLPGGDRMGADGRR